jgi:hypothetical protein
VVLELLRFGLVHTLRTFNCVFNLLHRCAAHHLLINNDVVMLRVRRPNIHGNSGFPMSLSFLLRSALRLAAIAGWMK